MKRLLAAVLMFSVFSAVAQDQVTAKESFVCIPEGVVRAAITLITQQQKELADLRRQLAERR